MRELIKNIKKVVASERYIQLLLLATASSMVFNIILGGGAPAFVAIAMGFLIGVLFQEFFGARAEEQKQIQQPPAPAAPEIVPETVPEEREEVLSVLSYTKKPETAPEEKETEKSLPERTVILDSKLEEEVRELRKENEKLKGMVSELVSELEKLKGAAKPDKDRIEKLLELCIRQNLDLATLADLIKKISQISPPQEIPSEFFKPILGRQAKKLPYYVKALNQIGVGLKKKGKIYLLE